MSTTKNGTPDWKEKLLVVGWKNQGLLDCWKGKDSTCREKEIRKSSMASREKRASFKVGDEGENVGRSRKAITTGWADPFLIHWKKLFKYSDIFANREKEENRRKQLLVIYKCRRLWQVVSLGRKPMGVCEWAWTLGRADGKMSHNGQSWRICLTKLRQFNWSWRQSKCLLASRLKTETWFQL